MDNKTEKTCKAVIIIKTHESEDIDTFFSNNFFCH